jgi:anti-anti-sigma factor
VELGEHREGRIVVLHPAGRMDARGARELDGRAGSLIAEGSRQLLMDLGGLERIESSGMRVLLGLGRKLEALDGMLVLCSLPDPVAEAFDVAGFDFVTTATRGEALELLTRAAPPSRLSGVASRLLGVASQRNVRARSEVPAAPALADLALDLLKRRPGAPAPAPPGPAPEPGEEGLDGVAGGAASWRQKASGWLSRKPRQP